MLLHDEQLVERAVEQALISEQRSKQHVLNCLSRLDEAPRPDALEPPQPLRLRTEPQANTARYDYLRGGGQAMNTDVMVRLLKTLNLFGMALSVDELAGESSPAYQQALPILESLLKAEVAERDVRSIQY